MQADGGDLSVQGGLGGQIGGVGCIHADVQFGEVNFQAEIAEAFQVGRKRIERLGIVEIEVKMCLKTDAVDRSAASYEVLRHRVNGVGLRIDHFSLVIVIEKLGFRIGGVRPTKRL